jgi:hypothetical protein
MGEWRWIQTRARRYQADLCRLASNARPDKSQTTIEDRSRDHRPWSRNAPIEKKAEEAGYEGREIAGTTSDS